MASVPPRRADQSCLPGSVGLWQSGLAGHQNLVSVTGDGTSQEGGLRRALLAALAAGDEPQPCNGRTMWLVIGLLTLSSPLAILLTQARPCC